MSVQQYQNISYGLTQPLNVEAQIPITSVRDPQVGDKAQIGTLWVNKSSNNTWVITSIVNNQANWELVGSGPSSGITIAGNSGGAVGPNSFGIINLIGEDGVTIIGNPGANTLTVTSSSDLTLTGNSGGEVGPNSLGNINIIGDGGVIIVGDPGTNTLTVSSSSDLTITGNEGGAVGPDGSGNISIIGDSGVIITGNPGTNTLLLYRRHQI